MRKAALAALVAIAVLAAMIFSLRKGDSVARHNCHEPYPMAFLC